MRGKDGAVVEETEQILEVLAKHWEELGKSHNSLDPCRAGTRASP